MNTCMRARRARAPPSASHTRALEHIPGRCTQIAGAQVCSQTRERCAWYSICTFEETGPDSIRACFEANSAPFCLTPPSIPLVCLAVCLGSSRLAPHWGSHNKATASPSMVSPLGTGWNRGRGVKETKTPQGPVILHRSRHVFSSSALIYHSAPASKQLIAFHTFAVCWRPGTFPPADSTSLQPNRSLVSIDHMCAHYYVSVPAFGTIWALLGHSESYKHLLAHSLLVVF